MGDVSVELCEETEASALASLNESPDFDEAKENCPPKASVQKDTQESNPNPDETSALQVSNVLPTWTLMSTVSNIVEHAYQRGAGDTNSNATSQQGPVARRQKRAC